MHFYFPSNIENSQASYPSIHSNCLRSSELKPRSFHHQGDIRGAFTASHGRRDKFLASTLKHSQCRTLFHSTILAASFYRHLPCFKKLIKSLICLNIKKKKTSSRTYSQVFRFRVFLLFSLGKLNVKMLHAAP